MQIALISDLHLEFRTDEERAELIDKVNAIPDDVELILNAGDLHPSVGERAAFYDALNDSIKQRYQFTCGNHDYYRSTISSHSYSKAIGETDLLTACTLWTDFDKGDPETLFMYKLVLNDARFIKPEIEGAVLADELYALHKAHLATIEANKPTVVMTHHAPSFGSCHERYKDEGKVNYYFLSHLDEFILANPNIKLWVHGHVHDPFDYKVGDCRVVCNPLGYPHEQKVVDYSVKFITI